MKKVVGIASCILFIIVELESYVAYLGNAVQGHREHSGTAGLVVGLIMLIAGIITLRSENHKGMLMTSIVFFALGALIGFMNIGAYKDLAIWSSLSLIFAILLGVHISKNKELYSI